MPLATILTHYYRTFSKPLRSISALSAAKQTAVLDALARHEPLPYRVTHRDYLSERHRIEAIMREQFVAKGGRIDRERPHYFVLGRFSLWEENGWGAGGNRWRADPTRIFDTYVEAQVWSDGPLRHLLDA